LQKPFAAIFTRLFKEDLDAKITYKCGEETLNPVAPPSWEDYQLQYLKNIPKDQAAKRSRFGIHRDHFQFLLSGSELSTGASQGQCRLFIYALKFTLYEYIKSSLGVTPILLLDDVFADLDKDRIEAFFRYLRSGSQVFLSSANYYILRDHVNDFDLYSVKTGNVSHGRFVL
jgi:DNA replication and repair protein RecF